MSDPFGGMPPEIAAELQALQRKQKMTELLMQQSQQPLEAPVIKGRFQGAVSPFQGLAKMMQAYQAGNQQAEGDKAFAGIGQKYQAGVTDAMMKMRQTEAGTPAIASPADELGGGPGAPAVAGDPRKAVMDAMMSPYLKNNPAIMAQFQHQLKAGDPYTLPEGAQRVGPDGKLIRENVKDFRAPGFKVGDTRQIKDGRSIRTQEYQADGTWKQIAVGEVDKPASMTVHNPAAVTVAEVMDPKNTDQMLKVDARTYKGGSIGSPGVLGVSGKLGDVAKGDMKTKRSMQGIGNSLQQAEDLLMGQKRDSEGNVTAGDVPTGSGIGSAVDSVAGFFGGTPKGAAEADSLKVVAGTLIQKVPRFEGPQSDKDVNLYKQMAADAGNEKKPREVRLAAVRKMRELYSGYESGALGRMGGQPVTPLSGDIRPAGAPAETYEQRKARLLK